MLVGGKQKRTVTGTTKGFVLDGTRHSLSIPEVFPEDHGTFSVEAKNVAGADSCSAVLNIIDVIDDQHLPLENDLIDVTSYNQPLTSLYSHNPMATVIPLSISKVSLSLDFRIFDLSFFVAVFPVQQKSLQIEKLKLFSFVTHFVTIERFLVCF